MYICNTYYFGDVLRFGIALELPLDPQIYNQDWLNGAACYWIFGHWIGDFQYRVSLSYDVLGAIENILDLKSFSCSKDIFLADAKQLLRVMNEDMKNDVDGVAKTNCFGFVGDFAFWMGFDISMNLDIMDECLSLLFEHDGQARLIIAKLKKNRSGWKFHSEHILNVGEVQAVFQEACDWLRVRHQQEMDLLENSKSKNQSESE